MIGRLVTTGFAIALVALSVFSGIGRQAIFDPAAIISGYGAQASDAMSQGHYGKAIANARAAILQRPMDQSSLSTLGAAHFARNEFDQAYRAFSVSALLGWRDPVTQRYWIDQSLGQNAYRPAAQWTDAMMRVGGLPGLDQMALAALEANAQGRDAILARISLRPSWLDDWVSYTPQLDDSAAMNRIALLNRARGIGIKISRDVAARAAANLFAQQRFKAALALWIAVEKPGDFPQSGLWDRNFSRLNQEDTPGPFDWQLSQGGSVELDIDNGDGATWLTVSSDSTVAQGVAAQATILPPGPVRLSWKTKGSGSSASTLYPRIRCATGEKIPTTSDGQDTNARWVDLNIPDACPAQIVTIWFDPGLSGTQSASISGLQLARLRAPN